MRSVGRESPELLKAPLQPFEHGVEHAGQIPKLIFRIFHGQAFAQPLGGDPFCSLRHHVDGRQRLASQRVSTQPCQDQSEREERQQHGEKFPQFVIDALFAMGHAEHHTSISQAEHAADHAHAHAVVQPSRDHQRLSRAFAALRRPAERAPFESGRAKEQRSFRRPDFYESLAVTILLHLLFGKRSHGHATVWCLHEQTFRRFQVLVHRAVQLIPQAEEQKHGRPAGIKKQQAAENSDVPEGQAGAHVAEPAVLHGSSRNAKPTPRTVWISFGEKGSSTFRRKRAMWTSITLSSGVARLGSSHTSRASISRDTTCPW